MTSPGFARDTATADYYDKRAEEYDEWYTGHGVFATANRPGWDRDVQTLTTVLAGLQPATTVDVACGTGFLTRHLPGRVLGVDFSPRMCALAADRLGAGRVARADALCLPLRPKAVQRVVAGHFYGHLPEEERALFLNEARRVAAELLVLDSAQRPDTPRDFHWSQRVLNDGSRHHVYKRYISAHQLAAEIGGQVLMDGTWFAAAHVRW